MRTGRGCRVIEKCYRQWYLSGKGAVAEIAKEIEATNVGMDSDLAHPRVNSTQWRTKGKKKMGQEKT